MQTVVEFAQVRGAARAQHMAARTFFDELEFAGIDLSLGGPLHGRLRKRLFHARRRHRYGTAAQLEGNDAVDILIFERGTARRNWPQRNRGRSVSCLNGDELL